MADYSANLTLRSSYDQDDDTSNRGGSDTSKVRSFRESVTLKTIGYVYHPDLMLFSALGSYGEDQDRTDENGRQYYHRGGFENYAVVTKILRAKPYRLDLSTMKDSPFIAAPSARAGETREESEADFKYITQAHKGRLTYHTTTVTGEESSDHNADTDIIDDYDTNYSFSKPKLGALNNFSFYASTRYSEDESKSSDFEDTTVSQQGYMTNNFSYSIFTFDSNFNGLTSDLDTNPDAITASSYAYDSLNFSERIDIRLPWDFNSNIDYTNNTLDSTNKWVVNNTDMLSETDTTNETLHFLLTQSLYESLDTSFLIEQDSLTTSRNQRSGDSTSDLNLVTGTSEDNKYELETQYTKILPHDSLATANLLSSDIQRKDPGLNLTHRVYTNIPEIGGVIQLLDSTETNDMSVDVLRDDNIICEGAVKNPSSEGYDKNNDPCWLPLIEIRNYTVFFNSTTTEIKDFFLSGDPLLLSQGFNPSSFTNSKFTFRVNSHNKAADYTTQINQFGIGLTLFQFISSNYQHSHQTQDGTVSNRPLTPEITTDLIGMGVSLYDWTFHAEREWQEADYSNTLTNLSLFYTKSRTLWNRLTLTMNADAEWGWATNDNTSGKPREEDITSYSYSLAGDLPLPYIQASLRAEHHYDYMQGPELTRYSISTHGSSEPTRNWGINDQTSTTNSISLLKPFRIPWVNFAGRAYAKYRWETQTTTNSDGISDGGKDRSFWAYGLNTNRVWSLGATSINFNANYAITQDFFDENNGLVNTNRFESWQREDGTNRTTVTLTIIRRLF